MCCLCGCLHCLALLFFLFFVFVMIKYWDFLTNFWRDNWRRRKLPLLLLINLLSPLNKETKFIWELNYFPFKEIINSVLRDMVIWEPGDFWGLSDWPYIWPKDPKKKVVTKKKSAITCLLFCSLCINRSFWEFFQSKLIW